MTDLEGVVFTRRGKTLVPSDVHADEWLVTLKDGREVIVIMRKVRSPQFHRWFWALARKLSDGIGWPAEVEALVDATKGKVGHVKPKLDMKGKPDGFEVASISWGSLDDYAFKRLVDRMLWAWETEYGIDVVALLTETDREHGGVYAAVRKRVDAE